MFITDLVLLDNEDGKSWTVFRDLVWRTSEGYVLVPKGFKTDLASIPRALRSFYPKTGKQNAAAVLHDYHYRTPELFTSKSTADKLFKEAMLSCGVKPFKANTFYLGVKWFGGSSWRASR